MNADKFREYGRKMVDYIADYLETIRERRVNHDVTPGYMLSLVPPEAPEEPEDFREVFKDIERIIMPGVTHWHSPRFHGYFAAGNTYPSILGDMLSDAIGCIGFSWVSSPACTELEVITTDWLGKMLGLPKGFLHSSKQGGGGVIQSTASETILLCVLAARTRMMEKYKKLHPEWSDVELMSKLVGYTSDQANSSVLRSSLLGSVKLVALESNDKFSLTGDVLKKAIEEDKRQGFIPFFLCATLGTTGACAFDNIEELGPICKEEDMWLHIDAAYAGSAFVCPEFRGYTKGIEYAETFSVNPHKWMLVNFDLSVVWIRHSTHLVDAFNVDPTYLKHNQEGHGIPDFRHWQIPLGRRFRSLKLWFMLRSYGVTGVQAYIRKHVQLAKDFEQMLIEDGRFQIVAPVVMGLVCFRLKGSNVLNEQLLESVMETKELFIIPASKGEMYYLRLAVCAERTNVDDIRFSYNIIRKCADFVTAGNYGSKGRHGAVNMGFPEVNGHILPNEDDPVDNCHELAITEKSDH